MLNFSTAPSPDSITVLQTQSDTTFFVGLPFNLTCVVNLPPSVDVPVNVDIMWGIPDDLTLMENISQTMENLTHYSSIASFVSQVKFDSIDFRCIASTNPSSGIVTRSKSISGSHKFTIGEIQLQEIIIIC